MARGSVDERGFEIIRRIRHARADTERLSLSDFKTLVRQQFFMLLIDLDAAVAAIAKLLPDNAEERHNAAGLLRELISAPGDMTPPVKARLDQMIEVFETGRPAASYANVSIIPAREPGDMPDQLKAS
jgi:hypothetical protein